MKFLSLTSLFLFWLVTTALGASEIKTNPSFAECPYQVSVKVTKSQTSCKSPNGELTAQANLMGNFSYKWYPADHLNEPNYQLGTGTRISNLSAGSYAVVMVEATTGCSSKAIATVADDTPQLVMNVTSQQDNITSCGLTSGGSLEIEIFAEDGSQNITTKWFSGPTTDYTKEILKWRNMLVATDLPAGIFTIQSTNSNTGCLSDPYTFEVKDVIDKPIVSEILEPNTACDPSHANGRISISISASSPEKEPANGYSVEWFNHLGLPVEAGKIVDDGLAGLEAGRYTVKATHPETQCQNTATFLIVDQLPVLSMVAVSEPNTICNPELAAEGSYNGAIRLQLSLNGQAVTDLSQFQIQWFTLNGEEETLLAANHSLHQDHLRDGLYKIQVIDQASGCMSMETVMVNFAPANQVFTAEATPNSSCDPAHPSGSVSILPEDATAANTFALYRGTEVLETELLGKGEEFKGLPAGIYTVMARNNSTGCFSTPLTVEIPDGTYQPHIEGTLQHNTSCEGTLANGSISISINVPSPHMEPANGYSVDWFYGSGIEGTVVEASKIVAQGLSGLSAGTYTVQLINPETQCQTTATFTIEDMLMIPELQVSALEPNTVCDPELAAGGAFNGAIELRLLVDGQVITDLSDFQINWFTLNGEEAILLESNASLRREQLPTGDYRMRATYLPGGCSSEVPASIDFPPTQTIITVETTPDSSCDPAHPNGSASLEVVGASNDYEFVLYRGTEPSEASKVSQGNEIPELAAGQYLVEATSRATGCQNTEQFIISAETGIPLPPVTKGAESCEPAGLNLIVEGEETYHWYLQPDGGTAFHTGNSLSLDFNETTTYYVTAISSHGCESAERSPVKALIHNLTQPIIEMEGNRLFTAFEENYTYQWYLDGVSIGVSGHELIAEKAGTYEVVVTNSSNCSILSLPKTFTISAVTTDYPNKGITLYPNPFNQRLIIEVNENEAAITGISIVDQQMKLLHRINYTTEHKMNVLELPALAQGQYILEIRQGERISYRRIVKQ